MGFGIDNDFPIEMESLIRESPRDFKLLERIPYASISEFDHFPIRLANGGNVENLRPLVVLDVITNTFDDVALSSIIEFTIVRTLYSTYANKIIFIDKMHHFYEDPFVKISKEVSELTGITSDLVKGCKINESIVSACFADKPLVIAHNASVIRPLFEKRFAHIKSLQNLPWACSIRGIKWRLINPNLTSLSLEGLSIASNYFKEKYNSNENVLTLIWLLNLYQSAFVQLLASADYHNYMIRALDAPFEIKDKLKQNGYRWDLAGKYWYKQLSSVDFIEQEKQFLKKLYNPNFEDNSKKFIIIEDAYYRFKKYL
ncbi:MAG: hypothetical protein ACI4V7_00600 [Succinivibrionaceae bacterium]